MSYDQSVIEHYNNVANEDGDDPSSTMKDLIIREKETEVIKKSVSKFCKKRHEQDSSGFKVRDMQLRIADLGCGNGYTLGVLSDLLRGTGHTLIGGEYNDKLRELATQRLGADVSKVDIRDLGSLPKKLDVIISQRVVINLLDVNDQKKALNNLVECLNPGGMLLCIEVMQSGIDTLNQARDEFGLAPIPPAYHNLPLEDDFFIHPKLKIVDWFPSNFLSSHYFVTRVFDDAMRKATDTKFIRNSHFVRFFSEALDKPVGNYAPLQGFTFIKA